MLAQVRVSTTQHHYPIYIGTDLFTDPQLFQSLISTQQVMIITDENVAQIYLHPFKQMLQNLSITQIDEVILPAGEAQKTLQNAEIIWTKLLEKQHHRDTVLIALGGGMVGDLAGFSAACYMRGVAFIQCPTSLLAQVDASIGGKTAVNHVLAKNVIGAFHHPQAVIIDIKTVMTQTSREYVAGFAELIKYGLILDAEFFVWLEQNIDALLAQDLSALQYAIRKACEYKANIVAQDQQDTHMRRLLNFGHTTAHALESLLDYESLRHGEAVAIGMVVALQLGVICHQTDSELVTRLVSLLAKCGLPTQIPKKITVDAILYKMKLDKKHQQQKQNFIVLQCLGKAEVKEDVASSQIKAALLACTA